MVSNMAHGELFSPVLDVTGEIKFSSVTKTAHANFLPGKICITKLSKSFYIHCVFTNTGKISKKHKLSPANIDNITCRDGRFSFYSSSDGGMRLVLQKGDQSHLCVFARFLEAIKHGQNPVEQLKNTVLNNPSPNQKQLTINSPQDKAQSPLLTRSNGKRQEAILNQHSKKAAINNSKLSHHSTPPTTPKKLQHNRTPGSAKLSKNFRTSQSNPKKSDYKSNERTKYQDDGNKENQNDELDVILRSPDKGQTPTDCSPRNTLASFGTPHKKRPLNELKSQEAFPKQPTPNAKSFYGSSSGSSIQKKRNMKKPAERSIFVQLNSPKKITPTVASHPLSESEVTSRGFSNLGNTCYMNAILQSFLGLLPFVQELQNKEILDNIGRASLCRAMYILYCCKEENGYSVKKKDALRRLKNSLSSSQLTKRFSGHLQNDAHEFMNICLDQMKGEINNAFGKRSSKLTEKDIQAKVCPVVRNFEGCIRNKITCKGCNDSATKDELFNHLSLNIPDSTESPVGYKMENLVDKFFQEETVERRCEKCECNSALQSFEIQALPRVMIFHLLRNEYHKELGTQEKKSDKINVNRFIDIGDYCSPDVRGPTEFIIKTKSPSKRSHEDNETPSSDIDDFVASKPRRRLDMSVAEEPVEKKPKEHDSPRSASSKTKPDCILNHKTPVYPWTSSLHSRRFCDLNMSDEEKIRRATEESLKTKQEEDERLKKNFDFDFISDEEALKIVEEADCLRVGKDISCEEQVVPAVDKTTNRRNCDKDKDKGNLNRDERTITVGELEKVKLRGKSVAGAENSIDYNDKDDGHVSGDNTNCRKRASSVIYPAVGTEVDATAKGSLGNMNDKEKQNGIEDVGECVETPTKRRKIEEKKRIEENGGFDVLSWDGSDDELKRVLEMSREEAEIEKAIELSLKDSGINEELLKASRSTSGTSIPGLCKKRQNNPQMYRLASIVSHVGATTSVGHYISDVFDMKTEQWTRYDDAHTERVNEHTVRYDKHVDGYIYFFMHKGCADKITGQKR